jgi:hypothetical protein
MTKRELPRAVYAAAGAGDLAYRRLRRLPEATTRTLHAASGAAAELRERAEAGPYRLDRQRLSGELTRLREQARRGGAVLAARAAAAQERAAAGYHHLVVHGEHVMAARTGAARPGDGPAAQVTAAEEPSESGDTRPEASSPAASTDEGSTGTSGGRAAG